jgi:hypothetical protein
LTTAIKTSLGLSAVAALLLSTACGADGNTGRESPNAEKDASGIAIVTKIPWMNAGVPQIDATGADGPRIVTSNAPYFPKFVDRRFPGKGNAAPGQVQTLVDPGSMPIDCSEFAAYETAPWMATMEPTDVADEVGGDPTLLTGIAARWAGADDYTRGSWRTPGFTTWYPDLVNNTDLLSNTVWGTPAQRVTPRAGDPVPDENSDPFPAGPVPKCPDANGVVRDNNYVLHMRGDGFRHILAGDNFPASDHCPPGSDLCPKDPDPTTPNDPAGFPRKSWQLPALHTSWDASSWEGFGFWARIGPAQSMSTLMVTLNDKYTSDDMNRENNTFCRRIYACRSQCQNYEPCSEVPGAVTNNGLPVYRCYDPAKGELPGSSGGPAASGDLLDAAFPRCDPPALRGKPGGSACTFRDTYPDADFEGKACRPYTFTSGESAEYCFNEEDLPPPSREERCGDGYSTMLRLTTDWKYYAVPFSSMRQGGYGKRSPMLDKSAIYSITLGWSAGTVDLYIDDVTLYRTRKL